MTLDELNRKYEGRPLDMKKWRFSGMSQVGGLALAANDVELDDGNFYDFNAVIEMGGNAKPSDIAVVSASFGNIPYAGMGNPKRYPNRTAVLSMRSIP